MAGLHALSHENDDNHGVDCAICIHVNTNNLTPTIAPDLQDCAFENTEFIVQKETTSFYSFVVTNTIASDQLFSRPPPTLL